MDNPFIFKEVKLSVNCVSNYEAQDNLNLNIFIHQYQSTPRTDFALLIEKLTKLGYSIVSSRASTN